MMPRMKYPVGVTQVLVDGYLPFGFSGKAGDFRVAPNID